MRRREQGDIGEASAIQWLAHNGALIFTPLLRSPNYDLIAEMDGRLVRIEVKTSNSLTRVGNWSVAVCTRGGNQSWNRTVKWFSSSRCDWLFVLAGDGWWWFILASEISARTGLLLGGPKYANYEVDRGRPLPSSKTP